MVSVLGDNEFQWPKPIKHNKTLNNILDVKYNTSENFKKWYFLLNYDRTEFRNINGVVKSEIIGWSKFRSDNQLYLSTGYGPTLTARGANSPLKFLIDGKIRTMNSNEAYKYMGFTDFEYNLVSDSKLVSESKMIYTCGNSISVEVLEAVFEEMIKIL